MDRKYVHKSQGIRAPGHGSCQKPQITTWVLLFLCPIGRRQQWKLIWSHMNRKILLMVPNQLTVSNCIHTCDTYCNIGVYFVFLPIFTDEPAAEFVHTRRHYLKSLMALREDGLKSFNLLLKSVQTSHLGEQTKMPDPKFFGGACSKKYSNPKETRRTRWLPDKMATATDYFGQSREISFALVTDASTELFKCSWRPSGTAEYDWTCCGI